MRLSYILNLNSSWSLGDICRRSSFENWDILTSPQRENPFATLCQAYEASFRRCDQDGSGQIDAVTLESGSLEFWTKTSYVEASKINW
jgi:hypothetical protein